MNSPEKSLFYNLLHLRFHFNTLYILKIFPYLISKFNAFQEGRRHTDYQGMKKRGFDSLAGYFRKPEIIRGIFCQSRHT